MSYWKIAACSWFAWMFITAAINQFYYNPWLTEWIVAIDTIGVFVLMAWKILE